MIVKIDREILRDLHIFAPPPPQSKNRVLGMLSICLYIHLASSGMVRQIVFIFGI
jgi:hypothetical protein